MTWLAGRVVGWVAVLGFAGVGCGAVAVPGPSDQGSLHGDAGQLTTESPMTSAIPMRDSSMGDMPVHDSGMRDMPLDVSPPPAPLEGRACGPGSAAKYVAVGGEHSCLVREDGALWCWGRDWLGSTATIRKPTAIAGLGSVSAVALGGDHACAISDGHVLCWGLNQQGQLGDGTRLDSATPKPVSDIADAVSIAAGFDSTCVVRASSALWCWGGGKPLAHVLDGVQQVGVGMSHACARLSGGRVQCWGQNAFGQLGNGTNQSSEQPIDTGVMAADLSVGFDHTCAIDTQGDAWCWGNGQSGQLGDGTTGGPIGAGMPFGRTSPVRVIGLHHARTVSAGLDHTCAQLQDDSVQCWGSNQFGKLGHAGDISEFALSPSEASAVGDPAQLVVAPDHDCALSKQGGVACWGENGFGDVGDGTLTNRLTPVFVTGFDCGSF
jgi:alpha-tubulin suppressor-like RCC1 family protein